MTSYWAVIPSCCRWDELHDLVAQLQRDDVDVVVIDTGYDPPLNESSPIDAYVLEDFESPKNISRWWNRGLRFVAGAENSTDFVVAVLNDDLVVPRNFVQDLAAKFDDWHPAIVCPDVYGVGQRLVTSLHDGPRMPGFAFAMHGDNMVFADESMQWWYGDNDVDWQARGRGGVLHVPGIVFQHLYPNSTTVGELAEQAGRDRQTFEAKWGRAPW